MCTTITLTGNGSRFQSECSWKETALENLSCSIPGNVLVWKVWPLFLWSCIFLPMVLKDKTKTTLFQNQFVFWLVFILTTHRWVYHTCKQSQTVSFLYLVPLCYWMQSFFRTEVACSCCDLSLSKQRFHLLTKLQKRMRLIWQRTKAFFIHPHWWEDQLGLAGVWDNKAQGLWHLVTHSGTCLESPSLLLWKPVLPVSSGSLSV